MFNSKIVIRKQTFHVIMIITTFLYFGFYTADKILNRSQPENSVVQSSNSTTNLQNANSIPSIVPSPTVNKIPLDNRIQDIISKSSGDYAVAFWNLSTNENYLFNEHQIFNSTSLYKLWVMAVVFKNIDEGKMKLDDTVTQDIAVLNTKFNISTESAEQTEGTISYTVKYALNKMITISDNYSALLLTEKVRLSSLNDFLKNYGFNDSKVGIDGGLPKTSAFDMMLFFEKLYKKELAGPKSTEDMIALLKLQSINSKIPKYLPDKTPIAHKTGELDTLSHDAGIVYTKKGDYILVVMTESSYPGIAVENVAKISKEVFDYFSD